MSKQKVHMTFDLQEEKVVFGIDSKSFDVVQVIPDLLGYDEVSENTFLDLFRQRFSTNYDMFENLLKELHKFLLESNEDYSSYENFWTEEGSKYSCSYIKSISDEMDFETSAIILKFHEKEA